MCRTVRDAATVLGALTGVDSEDSATAESRGKSYADYTQFSKPMACAARGLAWFARRLGSGTVWTR